MSLEERSLALLDSTVQALGPAGEHRAGQQQMVEAVARAFDTRRHLAVAAGTGTGKSLGYLVPAVLSGRRVVVATATKALQDQLAGKELPLLAAQTSLPALRPDGEPFRWAVLKGRSNYICRQLVAETARAGVQLAFGAKKVPEPGKRGTAGDSPNSLANTAGDSSDGLDSTGGDDRTDGLDSTAGDRNDGLGSTGDPGGTGDGLGNTAGPSTADYTDGLDGIAGDVARLVAWADRTETGERSEVPWHLAPGAWERLSVSAEQCPGRSRCPQGKVCFAEAARDRAAEADIVVVNAHLLVLDLLVGGVLPDHDLVVIDEAHQFDEVVTSLAGVTLGDRRLRNAAQEVNEVFPRAGLPLARSGRQLGNLLDPLRENRLDIGGETDLAEALVLLLSRLEAVDGTIRKAEPAENLDEAAQRLRILGTVSTLTSEVAALLTPSAGTVTFVAGREAAPELRLAPLEVGEFLRDSLFERRTVVMTSATLGATTPAVLGLERDDYRYLDVGSSFDYPSAGLLYCAADLPRPGTDGWAPAAIAELEALINAARGRTLALFTSYRMLDRAAEDLRRRLRWPLLRQGDLPPPQLLERFAADDSTCLLATIGFWQGVDVPGPALTLVTLDRLPFPRPDDPLLSARREHIGSDAFRLIDLRRAAILLAQGAGRLIRTSSDRGVVAVLDSRLATARYRTDILAEVPPLRRTIDRAEVTDFLAQL